MLQDKPSDDGERGFGWWLRWGRTSSVADTFWGKSEALACPAAISDGVVIVTKLGQLLKVSRNRRSGESDAVFRRWLPRRLVSTAASVLEQPEMSRNRPAQEGDNDFWRRIAGVLVPTHRPASRNCVQVLARSAFAMSDKMVSVGTQSWSPAGGDADFE
mmetsp:Transcript_86322/g.171376  ORF Transcript_86322/g.171376 Transcript_86322/m.171376 type:complete len:159 (-) Transcript_86322:453-929(-)